MDRSGEILIEKARGGDQAAFVQIFEAHRHRLREKVAARIGPRLRQFLDPEDVIQETFLRAFQTIPHFRPEGPDSFFRWLAALADHLVLNASRKKRPEPLALDLPLSAASASKALRREERLERLKVALRDLTDDQRQAVILARLDGVRTREIARRMGRTEEAVRQLISRGLHRLKRSIGSTDSFHLPEGKLRGTESDHA